VALLNTYLRKGLRGACPGEVHPPIINVAHHDAHAAIYFVSPFEDATVVVMDGYGDDAATSVYAAEGRRIDRQWHGSFFDSLGILYTLVTRHLGFQVFEEGTVMALAACGSDRLVGDMRDVVRLRDNGRFQINMDYFSYDSFGMLRPFRQRFIDAFGPARHRQEPLTDHHRDLARALQVVAEDVVLHVAKAARRQLPSRNLCFTGGVALNCVANGRLLAESGFDRVWVPPCASDTGAPFGSALWHHHVTLANPRSETMTHAYYGLDYTEAEVAGALRRAGLAFERLDEEELLARTAGDLADGRIVGWHQGRYEIGPRALGNRSILASPIAPAFATSSIRASSSASRSDPSRRPSLPSMPPTGSRSPSPIRS
jgi:carbamoyltransferase